MNFKKLKVNWNKLSALVLAGTIVLGFTGCGKNSEKEEQQTCYVTLQEQEQFYFILYDNTKNRTCQVSYSCLNGFLKDNVHVISDYEAIIGEFNLVIMDSDGSERVVEVTYGELEQYLKDDIEFKGISANLFTYNPGKQKNKSLN